MCQKNYILNWSIKIREYFEQGIKFSDDSISALPYKTCLKVISRAKLANIIHIIMQIARYLYMNN